MARPKKQDAEKRTEQTNERWTLAELEYLNQQAAHTGMSRTDYIRHSALSIRVPVARSSSADPALVSELNNIGLALKSGVGNNLNQYMRNVNSERGAFIAAQDLFAEIQAVAVKLDSVLVKVLADGS